MVGDPGDYILGGQTYSFSPSDGSFIAQRNGGNGVSISFQAPNFVHWWYLDFAAPGAQELTIGLYTGAVRFPFQESTQPGLAIYGEGRGCNTSTGSFRVKEIVYGTGNEIVSFWATFEQHCEGAEPALRGEIRFNANVVVEISAPPAASVDRNHELSFDVTATDAQNRTVLLTALDLPAGATFDDHGNNTGTFRWTPTPNQIGFHLVTFRADNGVGNKDETTTRVQVTGDLLLQMESDPGDYVGGGQNYHFGPESSFIASGSNGSAFLRVKAGDFSYWYLNLAAPVGAPLTPGRYPGALRFADADHPGLDVSGPYGGCNESNGEFVVKQIKNSPDGIESFWAYFEQHCEHAEPALRGEIRYNADVVVAVNAPLSRSATRLHPFSIQVTATDAGGDHVTLSASGIPDGAAFTDAGDNTGTFTWTPAFGQTGEVVVTFHGRNGLGAEDSLETRITVLGETSLALSSEPDAFIGNGGNYFYTPEDGTFRLTSGFSNGVNVEFGPTPFSTWRLEFAPPPGEILSAGDYPEAVRPGNQFPGQAGIYVSGLSSGCSQTQGAFRVKELTRDQAGTVRSFWARFRQTCDQLPGVLEGEIRYNVGAPLLVTAPPGQSAPAGDPLEFVVTGTAALPVTLRVLDLLPGATFSMNTDGSGTFKWTPTADQIGRHFVRFAGEDAEAHRDTAVTVIRVFHVNHTPLAEAGGPYQGSPGVPVQFDGSASHDPDGDALSYSWYFGDGWYGEGSNPGHAYAAPGVYSVSLTVWDGQTSGYDDAPVTILDALPARAFTVGGDDVIRLKSAKPSCMQIEPLNGSFELGDVDPASILLHAVGTGVTDSIPATVGRTVSLGDRDRNGIQDVEICFSKDNLRQILSYINGRQAVRLGIEGRLRTGTLFRAELEVYAEKRGGPAISLANNPAAGTAMLRVDAEATGAMRIRIYDVRGRLVRTIENVAAVAEAGQAIDITRGEGGSALRTGVYFFKVDGIEGSPSGKFVILR